MILKISKTLLAILLVLSISGCGEKIVSHKVELSKETTPKMDQDAKVKDDLQKYVDTLTKAGVDEQKAVNAYMSVVGSNYKDDETTYNTLTKTVIPTYEKFLKVIDNYTSGTKMVHQINQKYVVGANKQYQAFLEIKAAVEKQDIDMVEDANRLLAEATQDIQDFRFQLKKACDQYDIPIHFNNLDGGNE